MSVFSKLYENIAKQIEEHEEKRTKDTYNYIESLFIETVITSFEWENVPEFIRSISDYIEESFLMSSRVAFFEDNGKHFITPCYPNGVLQENGLYSSYTCIFRNGKTVIKKFEDIEIGYNNALHLPSIVIIQEMIESCVRALRAVDMSLVKAQLPSIFVCDDETKIDTIIAEIDKVYKMKKPYNVVSGSWDGNELAKYDFYDNRAVDIIALWDVFVRYKNLFFTTFGINNVEIAKSERLTRSEGESNTEITRYSFFNDMYKHRLDWIKRITEHFGYTMKISINRNSETVSELNMTNDEKMKRAEMIIAPYTEQVENKESEDKEDDDNTQTDDKGQ